MFSKIAEKQLSLHHYKYYRMLQPIRTKLLVLIIALSASMTAFSASAQFVRGEKSFGPKVGYVTRNNSMSAGLAFQYSLSSVVRIAPEIGLIFRHENLSGLNIDVNVHLPINLNTKRCILYPIIGVNYTSWGLHSINVVNHKDVTEHSNSLGVNGGAGFEYRCNNSMKLALEAHYSLLRHYSTTHLQASIAYIF